MRKAVIQSEIAGIKFRSVGVRRICFESENHPQLCFLVKFIELSLRSYDRKTNDKGTFESLGFTELGRVVLASRRGANWDDTHDLCGGSGIGRCW